MKTVLISIFFVISFSSNLFSQNISYKNLLGEWKADMEGISFTFANDSVVYFSVDKTATHRATYTMDKATHLFRVTMLNINKNGIASNKFMLVKYINAQTLKMQQVNKNVFKWNNKETSSNTGKLRRAG